MAKILLGLLSWVVIAVASVDDPSILATPPMGFNNWARFQCALNESLFTTTADAMVEKGLHAAGYNRLNLDDCWMQYSRAPNGSLQWNTTLFPHGIPWLAEYVKSRGFHLGIYEDSGNLTCGGFPGSKGYEAFDAHTFFSWGIDYLKLDGCNVFAERNRTLQQEYKYLYGLWHKVLTNLENPLIFSESAPAYFSGGSDFSNQTNKTDWYRVMDWVPAYGELARHSNDIAVYGLYNRSQYWESIMTNYGFQVQLARYQRPGYYNDPDFLIPDWPWLTIDEKKSHFALWASFSAPLIISAYIPDLSHKEVEYLTNKDIIAVDQDPLGLQATLVSRDETLDVFTKSLFNGDRLLTVLNRANSSNSISIDIRRVGLMKERQYTAKNLWTGSLETIKSAINMSLSGHSTAIYRFLDVVHTTPTGMIFNTASMKCLTASDTVLSFANCSAADPQVWQIQSNGLISPLSAPSKCISGIEASVRLDDCDLYDTNQRWVYHVSGNMVNRATQQCFTEWSTQAGAEGCGDELDSQVFGLPSGVEIVRRPDLFPFWAEDERRDPTHRPTYNQS